MIKSIMSKEPSIISAITHIQGSTTLRDDFEESTDFMLLTAPNNGNAPDREQRISSVGSGRGNQSKKFGRGPETGVELRYHNRKEYNKLSSEEQKELAEWRESNKNKENTSSSKISALEQTVLDLEAKISALTSNPPVRDPLNNPLCQRGLNK